MTNQQRFTFGYHLNTWDLGGLPLTEGLEVIRRNGFSYVEALARDELSNDFARRYMGTGYQPVPMGTTDIDFLSRIEYFSKAQAEGLRLSSLYVNREFVNPLSWDAERATLDAILHLLHGFDSPGVVLGGGPPARGEDHSPELYRRFAAALGEIGEKAAGLGMWAAYHPHIDTFIETREQLDRLMNELDGSPAGLCIDVAHLTLAGSDAVAAIHDYSSALKYVHYKDVADPSQFSGAARYDAFRPLGKGVVDMASVTRELLDAEYDGIVIIELDSTEQDAEEALQDSVSYLEGLGLSLQPSS
ncbi:sugar phosphate isomerase/epimerase [Herbiconiux sp. L3-i23]|uniref:sugar phosphate isomerase/epimerase family protein n=1 Tax=Herbiconiux sp. L3-i23 TaxID=2905871 RepID=UPI00206238F3|nr:sugar phosphate isomerase/epimerase [Herbiconiux sp. L3-i23]BDI23489.1 xylose isomerase [Herbiconiux sp. L3-i23]